MTMIGYDRLKLGGEKLSFTWEELTDAMKVIAKTPEQRERVTSLVNGIRAKTSDQSELLKLVLIAAELTRDEDPDSMIEEALAEFRLH